MDKFGVSFSIKQCRNFDVQSSDCLSWLIEEAGFKRFRLMSYWDEMESSPGVYNFEELDRQLEIIAKHGCVVTLCLGARQPRWPENHWPDWAWELPKELRTRALLNFLGVVVERYKGNKSILSYQLENEALLNNFGKRPEVDRSRLRAEYKLVKSIDPMKDIIMTTSTSWGIPLRRPIGDIVGFSYYLIVYNTKRNTYTSSHHKPWLHKLRAWLIRILLNRQSFIHELQLEPWGPKNIWEMSYEEQMKSMSPAQIKANLGLSLKAGLFPIDLWGGEWWYWCHLKNKKEVLDSVLGSINNPD